MKKFIERAPIASNSVLLKLVVASLAAVLVTGFSACSTFTSKPREEAKASVSPTIAPPSPTNSLPTAVEGVGHYGENLYDMAKARDWKKAATEFTALMQSDQQLPNEVKDKKAELERLSQSIKAAGRAIETKDRATTMREANLVTLIGADLAAAFKPPVPVEVTKLDYYGRELEIWAEAKNKAKLRESAEGMRRIWMTLRPMVEARGGAVEAKKFDELVTQAGAAKTPGDFAKLATPVLDEVDNLEKVFIRK